MVHRTHVHCDYVWYGHILMLVHSVTRCTHSVFFKLASVCIVYSGCPMSVQRCAMVYRVCTMSSCIDLVIGCTDMMHVKYTQYTSVYDLKAITIRTIFPKTCKYLMLLRSIVYRQINIAQSLKTCPRLAPRLYHTRASIECQDILKIAGYANNLGWKV